MEKIRAKINGEFTEIPKWKYLLNWWSPIIGIVTVIIMGTGMIGSFNERIFDNSKQKYETVEHTKEKRIHLTDEQKATFVTRTEFDKSLMDNKEDLDEIKAILREIQKELRTR